jgi:hypothetical protein
VIVAAKAYKRNADVMDERYDKYQERSERLYDMSKDWAKNYSYIDPRLIVRNMIFFRAGIGKLRKERGTKATLEMMRDWQKGENIIPRLKISQLLDKGGISRSALKSIVGKAACDLVYADPQVTEAPDERKDEVAAVLLLKKVEKGQQALYKEALQRIGTPDYLKSPDISFKEIEESKKEVAQYQENEYKKLPGNGDKAVQIMKNNGLDLAAQYGIDDYKQDLKIWTQVNAEPFTYMVLENQFTTLCKFLKEKELAVTYQFEPEDILTLKKARFNLSLLELQELWEMYKKTDSTPTPREFMDWLKSDERNWSKGGELHKYSMESAEALRIRAEIVATKADAVADAESLST